jgi:hypothetical protein
MAAVYSRSLRIAARHGSMVWRANIILATADGCGTADERHAKKRLSKQASRTDPRLR